MTFEWDEGGDEPADIYQILRSFDGSFFVELETGMGAQVLRAMRLAVHGLIDRSPARTLSVPTPGPFNTTYKTLTGLVEHHQYAFQIFAGTISNDGITIDWDPAAHQRLVKTLIKRMHSQHTAWIVDSVAHTGSVARSTLAASLVQSGASGDSIQHHTDVVPVIVGTRLRPHHPVHRGHTAPEQ